MKQTTIDPDWQKLLEELKVMQHRITAMQGIIVKKIEEQTKEKIKVRK